MMAGRFESWGYPEHRRLTFGQDQQRKAEAETAPAWPPLPSPPAPKAGQIGAFEDSRPAQRVEQLSWDA